jgi:hypothetical protein
MDHFEKGKRRDKLFTCHLTHFLQGINTKLDFHLQGAPNFRVADLNVYGVAQPTVNKYLC